MNETENKIKLSDLIDINFLQELQDAFAKTMNVASLTYDENGPVTKPSNFTDFCTKYTRTSKEGAKRCIDCDVRWGKYATKKGKPIVYTCHAGLTDFVVPIIVDKKHIGSIYGGQILTHPPDENAFREVARQIHVDEDEYIEALKKIKIISIDKVHEAANFLSLVANAISEIGHKNYELIEKNKKDNLYNYIVETVRSSLDITETKQKIVTLVGEILKADRCFIAEFDKITDKYLIVNDEYLSSKKILPFKGADVNVEVPVFAQVVKQGKPLIINNKEIFLQTDNADFELERAAIEKYNVTSCFAVPLFYFDEFLGVLAIHYVGRQYSITSEEINLMTIIANQIAIALHQSRLYLKSQQKAEKEALLRQIITAIRETFDLNQIKAEIVNQVGKHLNADRVFFADYDTKYKRYSICSKGEYRSSEKIESLKEVDWVSIPGFIENVRNSHVKGHDFIFEDVDRFAEEKGPTAQKLAAFFKDKGFMAVIAINMSYGEFYLGNLVVSYENKKVFPQEEIDFVKMVADQSGVAVYQANLYKTTQEQAEREIILRKTIEIIRSSIDIDFVKHEMVLQIGAFLNADRVAFADYDFEKGNYFIVSGNEYRSSSKVKTFVGYDFAATPGFIEKIREVHLTGKDIVFSDLDKYLEENNLKNSGIEQFYRDMGFLSSLAINIYHGELFYGNLVVSFNKKRDINEDDIKFIKTLADQAGIAIYQSTLYKKEKQAAERESLLRKIFETIRSTLDLNELFELICTELGRVFNIQRSFIVEFKTHNGKNEITIQHEYKSTPEIRGLQDEKFDRRTVEYWGEVLLAEDNKIIIDNIPESDTPDYFKETYKHIGLKSIMGFPIKQGDDKWGWVGVSEYNYYRHWTEEEFSLLETISSQIYIAIKQAELYNITQQNAQRDSLLRKITERIRSSLDIDETLEFISEETAKLFNLQRAVISSFPEPENFEKFIVKKEYKSYPNITGIIQIENFPKVAAYWGNRLMKTDPIFAIDNIEESDAPDYFKDNYRLMGVKSIIGTCIKKGDSAWGVLVLSEYSRYRHWTDEEKTLLETIASQIYIAINQAELFEKEKQAVERERLIAKVLSEAISTFDMSQIMQIVKEIGMMTKADRCYFVEVDVERMKGKRINYEGEYLASPDVKSIMGYEFSSEDVKHFVEMYLEAKDLIVFDYESILKQQDKKYDGIKRYVKQFDLKSGIGIPFYYMDNLIAVLAIEYIRDRAYPSSDELGFLRILGNQIGMAFSQIQLYQNTKVIAERQSLVARVLSLTIGSFDMSQIKQIVKEIGENTKADRCYFVEVDVERMKGKTLDYEGEYLASPDIKSIIGYEFSAEDVELFVQMYLKVKDLIFFDYERILRMQDEKYAGMKRYINQSGLKSAIGIPFYHMDKLTAVLAIEYATEKRHPSVDELSFLRILGKQVGMAFSQIQLYQNTKKIAERETLLRQVIETIRSSIDIDQTLEIICDEVAKIFRVQRATIVEFFDENDLSLWKTRKEFKSRDGIKGLEDISFDKRVGEYTGQVVMHDGKNFVIDDIEKSDMPDYFKKTYQELGVKSILSVPIKSNEDKFGVIFLSSIYGYRYWTKEEEQLLESIASQIYVAIKQAELFENQKRTAERELELRKAIEITKNQIEALLDSIPYLAWLKDIEGQYTAINKGFTEASKMSATEVIGSTDYEVWPVEFAKKYTEDDALVMKEGTSICMEEEALYNAEHRWTETCKAPIFDKEGNVVGTAGIARDITARRQELIELTESRNFVMESNKRETLLRQITELMRSSLDINEIKKTFVTQIGVYLKADRVAFSDYNSVTGEFVISPGNEYKSSEKIKTFEGYEFSSIPGFAEGIRDVHLSGKDIIFNDLDEYLDKNHLRGTNTETFYRDNGFMSSMAINIYHQNTFYGNLVITFEEKREISEEEIKIVKTLANQAGIAIYQSTLYQNTKNIAGRETLLRKIIETVRSSLDINEVKKNIIYEIGKAFKADRCYFRTYDKVNGRFLPVDVEYLSSPDMKSVVNIEPDQESLIYFQNEIKKQDHGFYPMVVNEELAKNTPLENYMKAADIKANYGIPIVIGEDEPIWLVLHYSKEDPKLNEDYKKLLETIAYQIEIAFNQIKLYNTVKNKADKELLLRQIIETIRSSLDIDETKQQIVNIIGKTLKADRCMVIEYDKKSDQMSVIKDEYLSSDNILAFKGVDINNLFPNFIKPIKQGKTLLINNNEIFMDAEEQNFDIERQTLQKYNITSSFVVPLFYFDEFLGALVIHYVGKDYIITEEEINLITEIANQIVIALHQAKLYKETQLKAEREKISKSIIEILRSTIDKSTIKHLFVQNIGKYFKADRVFFSDYDPQSKMYLPVEPSSEYLSSSKEKSFVGYDWSDPSIKEYVQPLLEKREIKIPCWSEYIEANPKSHGFRALFEDSNVKSSYNIPVLYQQEIMGYFCIEFTQDSCNKLSNEDISSIRSMCAQAGIALYHSELFIKAQESSRSKGEFIANISGELKTPLNNLIEFSEVLSSSEFDCSKQVEYLNNINKSSKQLLDLRNDIAIISRIESENFKLSFDNFELEELVNDVVRSIKSDVNNKAVNITTDVINENVAADKNMVTQIFYNLLNSAIRFASAKVNILLKSKLENERIISFIEISGSGLDSDTQNMIFEKFKQMDFSYPVRQQGVGLELSIVTKLVEMKKGYIHVESTDDRGTRVWFVVATAKRLSK